MIKNQNLQSVLDVLIISSFTMAPARKGPFLLQKPAIIVKVLIYLMIYVKNAKKALFWYKKANYAYKK